MAYLNFNKITPAAPNDPVVNEVTQLNDNWTQLDTKLQPYISGGTISNVESGQEFFNGSFRYAVWDGAATRIPDNISAGWSTWTNLPLTGSFAIRSGFQPKWRVNTLYRMVELSGGIQFNLAGDPWTTGTTYTVTSDVAGGAIPATYTPVGGKIVGTTATGAATSPSVVSGAYFSIDKPVGNTNCRLQLTQMGGVNGGNFIQVDQVWWWY